MVVKYIKSLFLEESEEDDPKKILNKFEVYVWPRAAWFKVIQRKRNEGESFDNFVKNVRLILMDSKYADTDDTLIDANITGVVH